MRKNQFFTGWGDRGHLFRRFCNMFSKTSPCLLGQHGSCSEAQQPGELSENSKQNLRNKWPPHPVDCSHRSPCNCAEFHPGCPWSNDALPLPLPPSGSVAAEDDPAAAAAAAAEVIGGIVGGTLSYSSEVLSAFSQRSGGGCRTKTWWRPLRDKK